MEKVKNWYTYNESKNNKIVHCDLGKLIFATTNSISFERESDRQMFLWFWVMPSISDPPMWSHPSSERAASSSQDPPKEMEEEEKTHNLPYITRRVTWLPIIGMAFPAPISEYFFVCFCLGLSLTVIVTYTVGIWTEVYHLNVIRRKDTYGVGLQNYLTSQRRRFELIYFSLRKPTYLLSQLGWSQPKVLFR